MEEQSTSQERKKETRGERKPGGAAPELHLSQSNWGEQVAQTGRLINTRTRRHTHTVTIVVF